jgi:DNA replication and repair protein RecF
LSAIEPASQPGYVAVRFQSLQLTSFRNHRQLSLQLAPRHIVLTGVNGAGKTNLLEAFSLFAPGRGLRRAAYDDMVLKGGDHGFALNATLATGDGTPSDSGLTDTVRIGTGIGALAGETASGRIVRINGTVEKTADALNDHCRISWLTPAMDGVFMGPAADRRRLLDRMVLAVQPRHGHHAVQYEKAMRGRNRLFADEVNDAAWFGALEQELALHGAALTRNRLALVDALNQLAHTALAGSAFPVAGLTLAGDIETLAERSGHDLEQAYRAALAQGRAVDRQAGRTLLGPHRSELEVVHRAKNIAAALSSTGEQKALLTGMILFHAELIARLSGMTAILLLDEVGAHFDARRRAQLFDILDQLGGQAIMTGTEPHLFDALGPRAQHWTLRDGTLIETDAGGRA